MAKINYLKRIGATYYARIDVPIDLVEIVGTSTKKKSLRTKDHDEAKTLVWPVVEAWRRDFDDIRSRREMTEADKDHAQWSYYTAELTRDDEKRRSLPQSAEIEAATAATVKRIERERVDISNPLAALDASLEILVMKEAATLDRERRTALANDLRQHLARGETALIAHEADAYIKENKLLIAPGSPQYRDLCQRLQRSRIEALERTFERDRGDYSGKPSDPLVRPFHGTARETAAPGETIMELFERYADENPRNVKPDTLNQARRDVGTFVDTYGTTYPAHRIDKKSVRDWKALLLKLPIKATESKQFHGLKLPEIVKRNEEVGKAVISHKTVNRYLSGMAAFCSWLSTNDYIAVNPVNEMFLKVDKTSNTQVFTSDELNTLFSSPLFTGCQNDDDWHLPGNHMIRDHRYWVPLIELYSGARQAEIAQLLIADMHKMHGQWVFHITTSGDNTKSVKTKGSIRIVPVHSELIALGLVDYRDELARAGEKRLFPKAERNQRGQMIADYSRDFGRFLTRIGLKEGRGLSLHSLRHGFADALRRAEYLDEEFGFLIGHGGSTQTGRYGQLPQGMLRQRVKLVEDVKYPGLSLSNLKVH